MSNIRLSPLSATQFWRICTVQGLIRLFPFSRWGRPNPNSDFHQSGVGPASIPFFCTPLNWAGLGQLIPMYFLWWGRRIPMFFRNLHWAFSIRIHLSQIGWNIETRIRIGPDQFFLVFSVQIEPVQPGIFCCCQTSAAMAFLAPAKHPENAVSAHKSGWAREIFLGWPDPEQAQFFRVDLL